MRSVFRTARTVLSAVLCTVAVSFAFGLTEDLAGLVLFPGSGYGGVLAADAVLVLAIFPLTWWMTRNGPGWEPDTDRKVSVSGWIVLFALLFIMYVGAEMVGLWLWDRFPTVGAMQDYAELSDTQLYLYSLRGIFAAPFLEEFTCRFLLFRPLRAKLGFWPAVTASALYFASIHGTLMHIPLAVGLTLLSCVVYSATGKYRYCVLFHMAFNWFAVAVVFSVQGFPVWARFVLLGVSYALIILLYVFRKKLFNGALAVGAAAMFEKFLDGELDKLADRAEQDAAGRPSANDDAGEENPESRGDGGSDGDG